MNDLASRSGKPLQSVVKNGGIRLPRRSISRADDNGEPARQTQIGQDAMQPEIKIRHHRELEPFGGAIVQHCFDLWKHPPGRARLVVTKKGIEKRTGLPDLGTQPAAAGRFPDQRTPPEPLCRIAVPIGCIVRRRQHPEDLLEGLADHAFLDVMASHRKMTGVNGGDGLGRLNQSAGGVEEDRSRWIHETGMPASQLGPVFPAKSRFLLQVKDFRDTRSAAQASSARWEWV